MVDDLQEGCAAGLLPIAGAAGGGQCWHPLPHPWYGLYPYLYPPVNQTICLHIFLFCVCINMQTQDCVALSGLSWRVLSCVHHNESGHALTIVPIFKVQQAIVSCSVYKINKHFATEKTMLSHDFEAPEFVGYPCSLCFIADSTEAQRFPGTPCSKHASHSSLPFLVSFSAATCQLRCL